MTAPGWRGYPSGRLGMRKLRLRREPLAFFLVSTVCASGLLTGIASATDLTGRVLLGAYKPTPMKGPRAAFHWELDNGFKETLRDHIPAKREVAVVLTGQGTTLTAQREVAFYGGALLPSTIVLGTGTTLSMRNRDEVAHEVEAVGLEAFGPEATAPGSTRAIHLTEAGSWPLRDRLAPHARGHLIVRPDLIAVGTISSDGRFTFEDVPRGHFTVRVYHRGDEIASQAIDITDADITLDPLTASAPAKPADPPTP